MGLKHACHCSYYSKCSVGVEKGKELKVDEVCLENQNRGSGQKKSCADLRNEKTTWVEDKGRATRADGKSQEHTSRMGKPLEGRKGM